MDQVYIRRHSTALSDSLAAVYAMSLAPLPTVGLLGGWLRRRLALHALAYPGILFGGGGGWGLNKFR